MPYLSLMFSDENIRKSFYMKKNHMVSQDVIKDLAITHILSEIKKVTPDFPEDFLLFSPYDYDTLNLRREIAQELYDSSVVLDSFEEFAVDLHILQKYCRNMAYINNKDAKNHSFLRACVEYCNCLKRLAEITKKAQSRVLRAIHDRAQTLFFEIENRIYIKATELFDCVNDMLSFSMRFDFVNNTVKIEEKVKAPASNRLSKLTDDLFGKKIDFTFSAVNNDQLSPFEELLLGAMKVHSPNIFQELELFYEENKLLDFDKLINLREEILFFTGYIKFVKKLEDAGFVFSFSEITTDNICAHSIYDLSLAVRLGCADLIVTNDMEIQKGDIFVVTGSNQGGKTTFLRAFGQCAFLASQGLPVPAENFNAPFFGLIATHFNRTEKVGKSRLEDEIDRIKVILSSACDNCLVLVNECFVGARHGDAVVLSERLFEKLFAIGATCGFVTHLFELPMRDARLVSFVADISQDGMERRTYHISKRSPGGFAHARSIAIACGATYEQLLAETQ